MSRYIACLAILCLFGCVTSDRVLPPTINLPEPTATVDYSEFQPKLRDLGWRINEAFYRDDWNEVAMTAQTLERAADFLKRANNVPPRLQTELSAKCDSLVTESMHLRSAAKEPSPSQVLTHLQNVHNLIRELRP